MDLLGWMKWRGAIVPIIDLRKRFQMESIPFGPTTVIIVVRVENSDKSRTIGMVVDAVSEVYRLDENLVQPLPEFGGAISTDFIKGLSTVDEKMLILLDIDKLVSIREVEGEAGRMASQAG